MCTSYNSVYAATASLTVSLPPILLLSVATSHTRGRYAKSRSDEQTGGNRRALYNTCEMMK